MSDSLSPAPRLASRVWIESPVYDSLFFFGAPVIGGIYLLVAMRWPHVAIIPGVFFLVGMAHYLSTFTFYLGDDQRAHYVAHPIAFFVAPLGIIAAAGLARYTSGLLVLLTTIYLWNTWHVSLQSCGILSVYRHATGGPVDEKRHANSLILSMNVALVASNITGFQPLRDLLVPISAALPDALFVLALIAATFCGANYIRRIGHRRRSGMPVNTTEAAFLLSSIALFHPYLWTRSTEWATSGLLFGHFIQYIGLVWLLHRRKYMPGAGSRPQRALASMSHNVLVLAAVLLSLGIGFHYFGKATRVFGVFGIWAWLFNALALVHFYLDGWIWAFKQPHVRHSLGPYLRPRIAVYSPPPVLRAETQAT